jgi:DNA-binding LytR/AlgR family response regulator
MKSVAKIYSSQPLNSTLTAEVSQKDHLFVKTNKKLRRINYSDILFIEGLKDYILIKTLYDEYIVHANIGNFTNHLPRDRFMRIHKSYTIAIDHIKTVTSNKMEIGPHLIPMGRSYQKKTLSLLNI